MMFFRSLKSSLPWNPAMSPSTRTVSARTHPNDVCDGSVKKSPLFAFALRLLEKSERYNVTPETSGSLSATTLTASLKTIPDALNSAIVVDSAPAATDASGEDASASAHAAAHSVALARRVVVASSPSSGVDYVDLVDSRSRGVVVARTETGARARRVVATTTTLLEARTCADIAPGAREVTRDANGRVRQLVRKLSTFYLQV